jgi:hypothetical protein
MHERRFGAPRCTVDRDKWRLALEIDGDTTHFCIDNCVSVLHSAHLEILYSSDDLLDKETVKLTPVQK